MSTYKESSIKVCCSSGEPQVSSSSSYEQQGTIVTLNDEGLQGYLVGSGPRGVIVAYDIFGFHVENTRRFVDLLAAGNSGLTCLMVDFYRAEGGWSLTDFPPSKGFEAIAEWLAKVGTWEIVLKDIEVAKTFLLSRGVKGKLGFVGFCWGGLQAIRACSLPEYGAGVSLHGAWLGPEDALKVQCPMMFLPAGDDPPIAPVEEVLKTKPFGSDCVFYTFKDLQHGFASARGNWNDENIFKQAMEANKMTREFLMKHLA